MELLGFELELLRQMKTMLVKMVSRDVVEDRLAWSVVGVVEKRKGRVVAPSVKSKTEDEQKKDDFGEKENYKDNSFGFNDDSFNNFFI
ncbi:hypothetical protein V6N13_124763 [Hibiscus sabdariffa]|uniref:Uncharacterized protein n=1 Tax=Hibiscus sabdariffa TaxID=183260 RepID=A0ABR2U4H1_9ROSI